MTKFDAETEARFQRIEQSIANTAKIIEESARREAEADKAKAKAEAEARARAEAEAKAEAEERKRRAEEDAQFRAEEKIRRAEYDRKSAELSRKMALNYAAICKLRKRMGHEGDRWGKMTESLLIGELKEVMKKRFKLKLTHVTGRVKFPDLEPPCDIDALAINGDVVLVFEAKATINIADINHFRNHILSRITELLPEYKDRKFYAGVAYIKTANKLSDEDIVSYAERYGLLVIKVIGKSNLVVNTKGFRLRNYRHC